MTTHLPWPDAQTLVALAIGLLAAVHVLKRWWPQWLRLWTPATSSAATSAAAAGACGTPASGAACGSGCGQCGSGSAAPAPAKDHRVHIVRRLSP